MVWDGECRFCGGWIRRWQSLTGDQVDYQPYQQVGHRFPELTEADYAQAVHLILPDGSVLRAAAAVFASLAFARGCGWLQKLYRRSPAFARGTEAAYRFVARHRMFFSTLTRLLWGDPAPSTYRFAGLLFTRTVGLVFLIAFLSFWAQSDGLVGDHGILPISEYFATLSTPNPDVTNLERFWAAPSLLWLAPNNTGLLALLMTGSVCSFLVIIGLVPAWALLGCVLTYGSLRNGVPLFLNYQWDALLVETGFVALLVAPWGWWQRPFLLVNPPRAGRWAAKFLFFKLMFLSGMVKILTNGPGPPPEHPGAFRRFLAWLTDVPVGANTWLDGTALQYHYFTQPIPATTSWWFAQRPFWFQAGSLWLTLFIEIVTPFAFFAPRRLRHLVAVLQLCLQFMLMATGNYGFFNLLAVALALLLFDDAVWPARVQHLLSRSRPVPPSNPSRLKTFGSGLRTTAASIVIFIGLIQIWETWLTRTQAPSAESPAPPFQPPLYQGVLADIGDMLGGLAHTVSIHAQSLGLVNGYGLFRVMTTERPEIIIEGSNDGVHWLPYEFYWKPGDVMRPPSFTTPHMPRLDWQMWFAALDIYEAHQVPFWLPRFVSELQAGNPAVLGLLEKNPFPNAPPADIRLRLFLYRFTTPAEYAQTGAWWTHPDQPELTLNAKPRQN
jgi:predicted DCC family thiol-disulfide oxidoreductase YuxK